MNKKAIFLPMFAFLTVFILLSLLYVIHDTEAKKSDLIGLNAITLLKLNDELEKNQFYLDLAVNQASKNALKKLADNGGYSSSRCEKTKTDLIDQDQYILLETCPALKLEEEFKIELKEELKIYITIFESTYQEINLEESFGLKTTEFFKLTPKIVKINEEYSYKNLYAEAFRISNITNIEKQEDKIIITLTSIVYPIEKTSGSTLTLKPKTKTQIPDFKVYDTVYSSIMNNCLKQEFQTCKEKLIQEFPGSELVQSQNLIKLKIPTDLGIIKLAFNTNKPIPPIV
ncbi:hypothetical protein J4216_06665 [Candidatus Woesearchaeota archaeon]|nr:hypothetical protein [Candidatus Woesearchaeota archaeon]